MRNGPGAGSNAGQAEGTYTTIEIKPIKNCLDYEKWGHKMG